MELTKQEKEFLKGLVDIELKRINKEKKEMQQLRPIVPVIALEERYDNFLENLKNKLE